MNKYNLGVELTQDEEDAYWEAVAERIAIGARRTRKYWRIHDRSLSFGDAQQKIWDTYILDHGRPAGELEFIPRLRHSFITEDTDIAAELIKQINLDFVHDFKSGLFFFDIFGFHEILMSYLYQEITGKSFSKFTDGAEKYVDDGWGMFKSTQNRKIMIGKDVILPNYLAVPKNKYERME